MLDEFCTFFVALVLCTRDVEAVRGHPAADIWKSRQVPGEEGASVDWAAGLVFPQPVLLHQAEHRTELACPISALHLDQFVARL